ncbi:MAG: protein kinase domain-containing protein, partial [Polyangiales bacterium]
LGEVRGRCFWIVEQQGRLEPLHAVQIGSQLAGALNAAHRQGIIHRDLKPANVQLDTRAGNFQARILDFGFAFLATGLGQDNDSHSARLTRQGVIFGTPEYMAPEQIKGQSADGRTDLYALGVLLYELLAGAPPFRGAPPASVFMKHLEDTPPPLELPQIEAHTAQRLRQLVFGLLEKDPEARPQSAAAVQLELLGIETELPDSGSLVQVLPGNPGAGLQGHPTYPDPALHDGHSSEIPTQMVPGKDLMVAVPGPAPVPTEPVAQVDQQIEAALSGARRARRVTWALAGIAVVLLLFLGGRWLVALWRQPTPNTSVRSVLQRQPIAQRENVQVRTVSGEEAGDSLPGGVPQAAYEVKRRELDAALAARGLRVRDVWVLQQARQLWKLQERAASAQAFDIAMEHLDSFAALAERSPSAHILRRRLAQARRRSPAAGVTEQAALKALAATVTQAANSPGGTRTFLRRLATIERSIATRTAKTKGAP